MKRFDQGHLHPETEVIETGGEHFRKKPFEQLFESYSEHLHMSLRQDLIFKFG
jgi:hypothetical protein